MRKYRKFNEGGSSDLEDFEDKAMPKRVSALDDLASGADKGSFDEDVYARAKRFVDRGGDEAPKAAAKPKAKTVPPSGTPGGAYRGQRAEAPAPKAASAEIPKGKEAAPASTGEDTSGPSNMDRVFMGLGAGTGIAGAAKLAQMRRAEKAAEMSKAAAAKFSQPQARQIATQTGVKKQPVEQVKRESPPPAKDSADTASPRKSRNIFERKKSDTEIARTGRTGAPRSRNTVGRDEEMTRRDFSSGGKVRGGGCEMRGKTRGAMR